MQLGILKFLQGFSSPFLDRIFEIITITAEENFIIVLAAVLLWCVNKELGYKLGFICLTGNGLNSGIKHFFQVSRPIGIDGIRSLRVETATGTSFPSGHTQGSTTLWTTLMINVKKKPLYIFGTIIFILVGISRMYLGVHWPTDIIGGILIGILWAVLISKLFNYCKQTKKIFLLLVVIIPLLAGLSFIHEKDYIVSCGAISGFYLGYILEDKYIQYDTRASMIVQILKFLIGIAVLLGLKIGLKLVLPPSLISDFVRYSICGLWATFGAPCLFCKLFRKLCLKFQKVSDKNP